MIFAEMWMLLETVKQSEVSDGTLFFGLGHGQEALGS